MTVLVIEHDSAGEIVDWRYEPDDSYTPGEGEIVDEDTDHRKLEQCMVDTSSSPPKVVEDPNWEATPTRDELDDRTDSLDATLDGLVGNVPVQRAKISAESKQNFRDARAAGDMQTQLDILFEIVTGEQP